VNTAQAQAEKEKIRLQLQEIEVFKTKIEELIAEGYDPKLDDGVGKNIAPLQKKGLLRVEVLNRWQKITIREVLTCGLVIAICFNEILFCNKYLLLLLQN